MSTLQRAWRQLRGHDCYACAFSEVFRSNGDGQVSRLHSFCRNPASAHHDRPLPPELWCQAWQRAPSGRKAAPEEIDGTGLTG